MEIFVGIAFPLLPQLCCFVRGSYERYRCDDRRLCAPSLRSRYSRSPSRARDQNRSPPESPPRSARFPPRLFVVPRSNPAAALILFRFFSDQTPSISTNAEPPCKKIYIGNLPESTTLADLEDCFGQLDQCTCQLKRGFGFVVSLLLQTRIAQYTAPALRTHSRLCVMM